MRRCVNVTQVFKKICIAEKTFKYGSNTYKTLKTFKRLILDFSIQLFLESLKNAIGKVL